MSFRAIPGKKYIAIGLVIALVAGMFFYNDARETFKFTRGAPTASIALLISETNQTDLDSYGTANIGTSAALTGTIATAEVPPLEPKTPYTIGFRVTTTSTAEHDYSETFNTKVSISGTNSIDVGSAGTLTIHFVAIGDVVTPTINLSTVNTQSRLFDFTPKATAFTGAMSEQSGITVALLGEYIDGATFTFNVQTWGSRGSYGSTTATLEIVVSPAGGVTIVIDGITTEVTP
jgi:hypothetical protein